MRLPGCPPLNPAENPCCFDMSGRGVYEVEEEMLALYVNLDPRWYVRVFQRGSWRLWFLEFQFRPTSARGVIVARQEYQREMADYLAERSNAS